MILLADLLRATIYLEGHVLGTSPNTHFDRFSFDSRRLRPGELFLALKTSTGDGHDYIQVACQAGATGILCENTTNLASLQAASSWGTTIIVVRDVQEAMLAWAELILRERHPFVVALAGSVGKTTTQHLLACALEEDGVETVLGMLRDEVGDERLGARSTIFANGNYNDLYGLPIALSRLQQNQRIALLELATDRFGEMKRLTELTQPGAAIITNLGMVNLAQLGDIQGVFREHLSLVERLPGDGLLVLNADDPASLPLAEHSNAPVSWISCENKNARFKASEITYSLTGTSFILAYEEVRIPVQLQLLGKPAVYAALAAVAMASWRGLTLKEIVSNLSLATPLPGRLHAYPGLHGATIIDDTYSASPPSSLVALDFLASLPGKRVAILGDMRRLGDYNLSGHQIIGERVAEAADFLITKGDTAEYIAQGALEKGFPQTSVQTTHTADDALSCVLPYLTTGSTILVKGSDYARLETVVAKLIEPVDLANVELVRQDAGWRQKISITPERPTWLEIDLGALAGNLRTLKNIVGPDIEIMAVVKADAYGHGAVRVTRTALVNGATIIGTATLSEALNLRSNGITAPILVLGYVAPWQVTEALAHQVSLTLFSRQVARAVSRAALALQTTANVHVKVDTGMSRLGLRSEDLRLFMAELRKLPGLHVEGIFTHFATADQLDQDYALAQLAEFNAILALLAKDDWQFRYIHSANSAATLTLPASRFNLVRTGIAMYGLKPSLEITLPEGFRPVLSFKTQVAMVKNVPPDTCVSYGCRYITTAPTIIATLPVGYGDGFRRGPNNWGHVLVRGQKASLIGTVCMDMCMIDVTGIPGVREGDEVVLIGTQLNETISADEVAMNLGTNNYEVVTQILARVPRESLA